MILQRTLNCGTHPHAPLVLPGREREEDASPPKVCPSFTYLTHEPWMRLDDLSSPFAVPSVAWQPVETHVQQRVAEFQNHLKIRNWPCVKRTAVNQRY